jgi:hypothetical protein
MEDALLNYLLYGGYGITKTIAIAIYHYLNSRNTKLFVEAMYD